MPNESHNPDLLSLKYEFDQAGPHIGPVRLLSNTALGFVPRTQDALEKELSTAFGKRFDCAALSRHLELVCRSLNEGDLAKAAIATGFLKLPPAFDIDGAGMAKASVDDPKHPGWPAKSPDGKGGEFRPKDDAGGLTFESKDSRIARLRARRSFRSILKRVLTTKRASRMLGELAGDLIPGLDAAAGLATIADDVQALNAIAAEVAGSKAALEFAEQAPWDLQDLLIDQNEASFPSYGAMLKLDLEKQYGPAGEGYQYHHLVEQGPNASSFSQAELQSSSNVVKLPTVVHEEINALYGKEMSFTTGDMTLRDFLRGASFEKQRAWGVWALEKAGALK